MIVVVPLLITLAGVVGWLYYVGQRDEPDFDRASFRRGLLWIVVPFALLALVWWWSTLPIDEPAAPPLPPTPSAPAPYGLSIGGAVSPRIA